MNDDVGSFSDEAARLADAVQAFARGEGRGRLSQAVGHMATGDDACCVCPLCTVIVLLRGERPELTGRLAESLAGFVTAGQGLLETLSTVTAEARDGAAAPSGAASAPTSGNDHGPRVQQVPLDDDEPGSDEGEQ